MNKIFSVLIVLLAYLCVSAATQNVSANFFDKGAKPSNITVIQLTAGNGAYDTLAATDDQKVYGPYNISVDQSRPMYTGFQAEFYPSVVSSTDSIQLSYQIIKGNALTDTTATWTAVDTCTDPGKQGNYSDISSKAGQAIVFKIKNIDATSVILQKKIRIAFKSASTEYVDVKR
jgi:hypothetical protein